MGLLHPPSRGPGDQRQLGLCCEGHSTWALSTAGSAHGGQTLPSPALQASIHLSPETVTSSFQSWGAVSRPGLSEQDDSPAFLLGCWGRGCFQRCGPCQRSQPQDESRTSLGPGAVGRHHVTQQREVERSMWSVSVPCPCCFPLPPETWLWVRLPERERVALGPSWASTPNSEGRPPLRTHSKPGKSEQALAAPAVLWPHGPFPALTVAYFLPGTWKCGSAFTRRAWGLGKQKEAREPAGAWWAPPHPTSLAPLPLPPPARYKAGREGPAPTASSSRVLAP